MLHLIPERLGHAGFSEVFLAIEGLREMIKVCTLGYTRVPVRRFLFTWLPY